MVAINIYNHAKTLIHCGHFHEFHIWAICERYGRSTITTNDWDLPAFQGCSQEHHAITASKDLFRETRKLLLFWAKLAGDNKDERKLVHGALKTTISGQPSVQCILQERLPKALNSGSQNVLKCLTRNRRRVQSGAKALSSQMHIVEDSQMDTPCTTPTHWWKLHQNHLFLKIKMGDIWAT